MQTGRIFQAIALLMIAAIMAGCAATNQYMSKLLKPRPITVKDTQAMAIKFLELKSLDTDSLTWVKNVITKDVDSTIENKNVPITTKASKIPLPEEPVAKTTNPDGTRSKRMRD